MKKGLKKFGKGMLGLFVIKLLVLGVFLVYQACDQGESLTVDSNLAQNEFITSLKQLKNDLSNVKVYDKNKMQETNLYTRAVEDDLTEIKITKSDPNELLDSIMNFDKLSYMISQGLIEPMEDSECDANNEPTICETLVVNEQEVQQAMEPSLQEAKNYLYSKGYNDADIAYLLAADNEGPEMHESVLIPTVMAMIEEENNQSNSTASSYEFSGLFISSAYAYTLEEQDLYDCALRTLGISELTDALAKGINSRAGKTALKKAIRKVAVRVVGWVGAVWAAYEFGDCMGWW